MTAFGSWRGCPWMAPGSTTGSSVCLPHASWTTLAEPGLSSPLHAPKGKSCWWLHRWPRTVPLALQLPFGRGRGAAHAQPLPCWHHWYPLGVSPARGIPEVKDRAGGFVRTPAPGGSLLEANLLYPRHRVHVGQPSFLLQVASFSIIHCLREWLCPS